MGESDSFDVAVIGGGIVGLAVARAVRARHGGSIVVLEAERRLAEHQTGHNSGVIHSGLYYKPGSLKARNCVAGREELYRFCEEHGLAHDRCGKVVIATTEGEIPALDELERRGRANGLEGIVRLDAAGIAEHEPHARGLAGLWVPQTGIVDYREVAETLGELLTDDGAVVIRQARVTHVERQADGLRLQWPGGEIQARALINCAGLQADRVARMCGVQPDLRIVPFRGEYHKLTAEREGLVRNLIYPVPDSRFPFLGVHFTRMIHGGVEAGPNAVLALRREGYTRFSFSARDTFSILSYIGFWRLAARFWSVGVSELYRSFNKEVLARDLRSLIPDIKAEDLVPHGSGVRAQAIAPDGSLVDDFRIVAADRMLHVFNTPSPAATASLSIGRIVAERFAR